jgi:hypothetical protein
VLTLRDKVLPSSMQAIKFLCEQVGTQNFNIGQTEHEGLKLKRFSRYHFESESIFLSFLLFSRFASCCNMNL